MSGDSWARGTSSSIRRKRRYLSAFGLRPNVNLCRPLGLHSSQTRQPKMHLRVPSIQNKTHKDYCWGPERAWKQVPDQSSCPRITCLVRKFTDSISAWKAHDCHRCLSQTNRASQTEVHTSTLRRRLPETHRPQCHLSSNERRRCRRCLLCRWCSHCSSRQTPRARRRRRLAEPRWLTGPRRQCRTHHLWPGCSGPRPLTRHNSLESPTMRLPDTRIDPSYFAPFAKIQT